MKIKNRLMIIISCLLLFVPVKSFAKEIEIKEINMSEEIDSTNIVKRHNKIFEQVENMKNNKKYIFPEILALKNPYGTNTTSLNVFFETINPSYVEYKVETLSKDINEFSARLYNDEEFATKHEYQIVGIVPGEKNKITIIATDNLGNTDKVSFIYDAPEIKSKSYSGLYIKKGSSKVKQLEGFFIIPTMEGYSLLIDNDGNIRGELSTRFVQFKIDKNYLYTIANGNQILKIDKLGRIIDKYGSKNFNFHHDFTISENNILALATNNKTSDVENRINDSIVSIDLETGNIKEVIDFKSLLPDLYKISRGIVKHNVLAGKGKVDALHLNTIDVDKDKNILVSSRETSSIIKINMSDDKPKLQYIISSPSVWEDVGNYDEKLLEEIGNSKPFSGQHSTYIHYDESLEENQYYITIFDNNSAIMESRPNFDWKDFNKSYKVPNIIRKDTKIPKGVYSYYHKYLIDENNKEYKLVESIKVPFSFFQSSAQYINNHIIYNSSWKGAFGEYDNNNRLINSYMLKNNTHPYRIEKMDFINYWFK